MLVMIPCMKIAKKQSGQVLNTKLVMIEQNQKFHQDMIDRFKYITCYDSITYILAHRLCLIQAVSML